MADYSQMRQQIEEMRAEREAWGERISDDTFSTALQSQKEDYDYRAAEIIPNKET